MLLIYFVCLNFAVSALLLSNFCILNFLGGGKARGWGWKWGGAGGRGAGGGGGQCRSYHTCTTSFRTVPHSLQLH